MTTENKGSLAFVEDSGSVMKTARGKQSDSSMHAPLAARIGGASAEVIVKLAFSTGDGEVT